MLLQHGGVIETQVQDGLAVGMHASLNDDEDNSSKSGNKNKKRSEKRTKARVEKLKQDGMIREVLELQDPIGVLRDKLQEAKTNKDHKLAAQLRQDIWLAQDSAAGYTVTDLESLGAIPGDSIKLDEKTSEEQTLTKTSTEAPSSSAGPSETAGSGPTQLEKRLRNLKKKLQQIKTLKEKRDKGGALEETQVKKIKTEDDIINEIEEIEDCFSGKFIKSATTPGMEGVHNSSQSSMRTRIQEQ